ncbi:MAG: DUF2067 domain-containing protein [Candidatus Heimdallarchaeota archaeon]|nr:DUF2067 domain-containing protein [Candidatus Heimdallarchaeota archaeon]
MARTTTKEIYVNIIGRKSLETFIELVSDALKYVEFTLTYKEGVVKVRLYGEKEVVNQSVITVKSYGKMFIQSSTPDKHGYYTHNLKLIQQIGSKIISLDTISTVLIHSGVYSMVEGQDLITTATMQEVQQILEQLHDLIQETPLNVRTQIMKRVLATISYCTDLTTSFVLDKGLELEYFKTQQNTVLINYEPKKCITDLIELLSKESS